MMYKAIMVLSACAALSPGMAFAQSGKDGTSRNDLPDAIKSGDVQKTRTLLDRGVNPNVRDKTWKNWPALHIAIFLRQDSIAQMLIEHHADVNSIAADGRTPLMQASERNSAALIRKLLDHGARINQTDNAGDSALIIAARYKNAESAILLASVERT